MEKKKSNKSKIAIIIVIILIIALAAVVAYLYTQYSGNNIIDLGTDIVSDNKKSKSNEPKTFAGTDRPIAVMIDNHADAMPHAGLDKAYMIYEIIVEGGETRLMALFKGANVEKIGPVRSSRHYFLDYARENDAIYVHFGWSPEAESDIKSFGINNINGITDDYQYFWRVKDKKAPHNAVTSTERIMRAAADKGYRTTSNTSSVLKYQVDEVNLDEKYSTNSEQTVENNSTNSSNLTSNSSSKKSNVVVENAEDITIPFSQVTTVQWKYDSQNKNYLRYCKKTQEVDWDTNQAFTAKNIIIEFIKNEDLDDGENKDRQTMSTIGIKDGMYITNGKAIKIKCEKTTRGSKTVYKDMDGNEIKVNDGNTFVEICPIDASVVMK